MVRSYITIHDFLTLEGRTIIIYGTAPGRKKTFPATIYRN